MNPYFEPQQASPFLQPPQSNSTSSPETQPSSNIDPALPPVQNRNNYPSLYPPYLNPETTQPNPYQPMSQPYNPPGYVPPGQYGYFSQGVFIPLVKENDEKARWTTRMKDLEKDMESCGVKCYKYWMYWIMLWCALGCLNPFVRISHYPAGSVQRNMIIYMSGYCLWSFVQSLLGALSISNKNVGKATAACWLMSIYVAISLVVEFCLVDTFLKYYEEFGLLEVAFLAFVIIIVTGAFVIHIFLSMTMSFKVRKILIEMKDVEMKLIECSI